MELKLTTKRILEFEERTGKDVLDLLQNIAKTNRVSVKDMVELFIACGEGYTLEMFEAWEASFMEKSEAILNAVAKYLGNASSTKVSKAKK